MLKQLTFKIALQIDFFSANFVTELCAMSAFQIMLKRRDES